MQTLYATEINSKLNGSHARFLWQGFCHDRHATHRHERTVRSNPFGTPVLAVLKSPFPISLPGYEPDPGSPCERITGF